MSDTNHDTAATALMALKSAAATFAQQFIQDSAARKAYLQYTAEFASNIWDSYAAGNMTAREAAEAANQMRNEIMEATRLKLSPIGKAASVALKEKGKLLEELLEHYAKKMFKKGFHELDAAGQTAVYEEVVKASGRANPRVSAKAARMGKLARGLWVITIGIAVYNIATSENMVHQACKEAMSLGTSIVMGTAVGAVGGARFGPWGAAVGALIGGVLGGIMGEEFFDLMIKSSAVRKPVCEPGKSCYLGMGAVQRPDGIIVQAFGPKL
ncbi:MAG: hypothetical protein KF889_16185 [Alphaproteobacteria bacterium]|nr:hypothetical protein [Alphaproteobacteria bacterium]MCW5740093.1 hypothetical protein [Alphaproteobacteria bacterium]